MPKQPDTTVFQRMYGLNMKLADSVHVVRQGIDNGRWYEVLIGLRDVHQQIREAGACLKEIEPEGYKLLADELAKLEKLALQADAAAATVQAVQATKATTGKDEGRVIVK